jgi:hypothetical protein
VEILRAVTNEELVLGDISKNERKQARSGEKLGKVVVSEVLALAWSHRHLQEYKCVTDIVSSRVNGAGHQFP